MREKREEGGGGKKEKRIKKMSSETEKTLKLILEELRAQRVQNAKILETLCKLTERVEDVEQKVRNLKEERKQENLGNCKILNIIQEDNFKLKETLHRMEKNDKKLNLIFYGLEENTQPDNSKIEKILGEKFGQHNIQIESTKRLGRARKDKRLDLIVKFKKREDRWKILQMKKEKLKDTPIFITEDLTFLERGRRKFLRDKAGDARIQGKKTFIKQDTLIVNGICYQVVESQGQMELVEIQGPKNDGEEGARARRK